MSPASPAAPARAASPPRVRTIRSATATCIPTTRSRIAIRPRSPPARLRPAASRRTSPSCRTPVRSPAASTSPCRRSWPRRAIAAQLLEALQQFYAHSPFVHVTAQAPRVKDVAGSNYARLGVVSNGRSVAVMSVIDNLDQGRRRRRRAVDEPPARTAGDPRVSRRRPRAGPEVRTRQPWPAQHLNRFRHGDRLPCTITLHRCSRSTRCTSARAEGVWLITRGRPPRARSVRRPCGGGARLRAPRAGRARSPNRRRR